MGDIFAASLDCPGIFFCPDNSEFVDLVFYRATADQDDIGQMVLSFASHVNVIGSLQPDSDGYPRYLHGALQEIQYKFIVLGNAPILIGDRCEVSNHALEAKYIDHWGNFQTEIGLTYVR